MFGNMMAKNMLGAAALCALMLQASAPAHAADAVPDLGGGWNTRNAFKLQDPPSGAKPVGDLFGHVHRERGRDAQGRDFGTNAWIGDYTSPILTPWAAAILKTKADAAIGGTDPFWAPSVCYPGGVSTILWVEPIFFLQTPKEVTIIFQRDHQVRHVYLNVPHSAHPAPSWYGESVGHYEGNALVIDTIGFNDKTFVDHYGTPHSEKLHVVERYHVSPDGKALEGDLRFDDATAYTMPWSAVVKYRRDTDRLSETVCAEDTTDNFTGKPNPIPVASRADF
jgi:hypothetical protein